MTDLLVSIIFALCPVPNDGGTTKCMEDINNCAVQSKGEITTRSIEKCLEKTREKQSSNTAKR